MFLLVALTLGIRSYHPLFESDQVPKPIDHLLQLAREYLLERLSFNRSYYGHHGCYLGDDVLTL
jgi:hypothetical protein